MKILAIGPGESTQWLFNRKDLDIPQDITLLGMHRVFPHIDIDLDYWTWADPDASIEGLKLYKGPEGSFPKVILPSYLINISSFSTNAGTSPIIKQSKNSLLYDTNIEKLKENGKVEIIPNSKNTRILPKTHKIFTNPVERFKGDAYYFGTVPFDGRHSESKWARENKFTSLILPICHYLKATEVYCIGFDNRGTGIKRKIPQSHNNPNIIKEYLSKYLKWLEDWKEFHNINIYSITPDRFSPNNTVMDYRSVEDLGWIR